nr:aspartate aminotransferase family protein [Falsirhodobacter deserti]
MINGFNGNTAALPEAERHLVERRQRLLGPSYRLFYDHPLHPVRAEGVRLYDAEGVEYLDCYNNVPSVGHCHPHVVAAIQRQAAVLNTHTRYLDEAVLDYSERLLATFPAALDRVMYTCTGSEAVDLALRIARFHTGAAGIIISENAYHGLTAATAAISPSLGDSVPLGPEVMTVRPGPGMAAEVEAAIAHLARRGIRTAAFIADSIFSTDGVIADPPGFLQGVIEAVHRAGALYIADEVQPGFGRLGSHFWGFMRHGITPDIVVMGKPMGNGMPIAAAVARSEVLERFGLEVRYFNTFGANHVSVAAAAAVLDVIEAEGLVANAARVGQHMAAGMRGMGEVRGAGLFLALDLGNAARAARVVNGLRARRVLIGASGKDGASLKIRPPLPFTEADADIFLSALADTLAHDA